MSTWVRVAHLDDGWLVHDVGQQQPVEQQEGVEYHVDRPVHALVWPAEDRLLERSRLVGFGQLRSEAFVACVLRVQVDLVDRHRVVGLLGLAPVFVIFCILVAFVVHVSRVDFQPACVSRPYPRCFVSCSGQTCSTCCLPLLPQAAPEFRHRFPPRTCLSGTGLSVFVPAW